MLKNYIKIAWRNLRKNKIDSTISIGGLAVSIACCLLLVAFVRYEWSFDEFHEKGERIYLVYHQYSRDGEMLKSSVTPYPLADIIGTNIPEVEKAVRWAARRAEVKINNKFVAQKSINMVKPAFLKIFNFPLVSGNPNTALDKPNSILLTQDKAKHIFGTLNIIGKTLVLRQRGKTVPFIITGILKNIPLNSSFKFEYLIPFENPLAGIREDFKQNWYVGSSETYLLLDKNVKPTEVLNKITAGLGGTIPERYLELTELGLMPLTEMYLAPGLSYQSKRSSNPLYSWLLAGIAFVVLAIAAINFMSLTLSRASRRSNEINIRKTVGAGRGELSQQFLGEAFITCLLALVISGFIAELSLPWFQSLIDKPVTLGLINHPIVWLVIAGLLLIATLITGGYPAWVMARKKTAEGFVSRTTSGKTPMVVKGLIVVQFALAIAFLSSAFIMNSQMNLIAAKDLGFNPDNLLDIKMSLTNPKKGGEMYEVYSQKALQIPSVKSATPVYGMFGHGSFMTTLVTDSLRTSINVTIVDESFLETMGIDLIAGRSFSAERLSDFKTAVLLNQEAVQLFGWQNPIGKIINQTKYETLIDEKKVIGVIENYHFRPLFYPLQPVVYIHRSLRDNRTMYMRIKVAEGKMTATIDQLRTAWNNLYPNEVFSYSFIEAMIEEQYAQQRRWKSIMELASVIAILIACFGLFGLTALATQRRKKEIGIRKVLGARVRDIVQLISRNFILLVLIGFVLAVPVAWYAMNKWLQEFAYKIEIGAGIFLLAGALAVFIALATVSWQSIRAALANPTDSLRSE